MNVILIIKTLKPVLKHDLSPEDEPENVISFSCNGANWRDVWHHFADNLSPDNEIVSVTVNWIIPPHP